MTEPEIAPALEQVYGAPAPAARVTRLRGDASTRIYYRVEVDGGRPASLIVMHLPPDVLRSDEGTSGAAPPTELPFLNVQRFLAGRGVPVPDVLAVDLGRRVVLLEDLGDETFEVRLHARGRGAWPSLYGTAVDLLAELHARCAEPDPACMAYGRRFDEPLLRWELDHFREWGLEALYGPLEANDRAALDRAFDALAGELAGLPPAFVHRDYQSRNLLWARDPEQLVVIDFQDALLGPRPYDLVALLCDSYVAIDADLQVAMIERYAAHRRLDPREFASTFFKVTVQRKLKDAGRFVFIDRVRKNASFLPWYAPSLAYVGRALATIPQLAPVAELLQRVVPGFPDAVPPPARNST